ncbi:glycyl-tRNA synthetase [Basidiobolus meristosporus CBS 931.73]|uniref:Glycyl-tRNA synthetase n=1 Tax=Basidiobolus meristosporus CBS 931.73 TaxID=1314790 RepID=A0A1Y1WT36_9FUNG|nr:glycyl-tRNA synthetase [Basidiobolus meristosporus CBS 931.73]|eukprot:ORX76710.1 glycyl-tRNA synthetase [Basidiobolus meristosporus CBS 931.73]
MVYKKDNVVGVDTSIITPPGVFKASGHLESFTDALVDCKLTKERFRADKAPPLTVIEKNGRKVLPIAAPDKAVAKDWEQMIQQLLPGISISRHGKELVLPIVDFQKPASVETAETNPGKIIFEGKEAAVELAYRGYVEPNSNSPFLTDSRPFNLMFKTFLDPIDPIERVMTTTLAGSQETDDIKKLRQSVDSVLAGSTVFLRPETAQGVFVNFLACQRTQKLRPPFGIAQIGKSFRNEIRLEHAIFRTPEFEQMELEYFVPPEDDSKWLSYWTEERFKWWKRYANHPENFRQRPHEEHELAHYAKGCVDVEYKFPWGWGEVEGVANRGDYDLKQHSEHSGVRLDYSEDSKDLITESGEQRTEKRSYVPYVIESSCGLNRALLAYLVDAYSEDSVIDPTTGKSAKRPLLRLHPQLAPIKVAVMPLMPKPELMPLTKQLVKAFRRERINVRLEDQNLKIGKRYYRHDEIGTPWCVTVDYQSLEDNMITIRDRDTMEQKRVDIEGVVKMVKEKLTDVDE